MIPNPSPNLNPSLRPWRHIAIFASAALCGLFIVIYLILVLIARADHNAYEQLVLVATAAALLAAGLVTLLVQAFAALAEGPRRTLR